MPTKAEKQCTANLDILYAVGDGAHAFQTGTFCQVKNGNAQEWNGTGKTDKAGTGKWKLRRFLFFSSPYWVLAVGPEYRWALVGTPNHKKLWVLSKGAVMAPELLAEIEKQAAAQGYDLAKLVKAPGDAEAL